jgi:eukaryotic-like serine/threonine-protein kinase
LKKSLHHGNGEPLATPANLFRKFPKESQFMFSDASDQELLLSWKDGSEGAAAELVKRFTARLHGLVNKKITGKFRSRFDSEDLVNSAWRSFFIAVRNDQIVVSPQSDVWPILALLANRKISKQVRHHLAGRRSIHREVDHEEHLSCEDVHEEIVDQDMLNRFLAKLNDRERAIVELRLQGLVQKEIAIQIGCAERTVRRVLHRIVSEHRPTLSHTKSPRLSIHGLLLQEMVGMGGFAKVYRAMQLADGMTVAVKFLRRSLWSNSHAVQGLLREVEWSTNLSHPNLLQYHGWGMTTYCAPFLVMDWIDGETVSRWFSEPRSRVDFIRCVRDVALAMSAVHQAGYLHGDLSPFNILRARDGRFILADFGMMRPTEESNPLPIGGTAGFIAPEQLDSTVRQPTKQADIYGYGSLLKWIAERQKLSPTDAVYSLIHSCLRSAPADRPHSFDAILLELE